MSKIYSIYYEVHIYFGYGFDMMVFNQASEFGTISNDLRLLSYFARLDYATHGSGINREAQVRMIRYICIAINSSVIIDFDER